VSRIHGRCRCLIGPLLAAVAAVLVVPSGMTLRFPRSRPAAPVRAREARDAPPIAFEINNGQTDPSVSFLARGRGFALFLTPNAATLRLRAPAFPASLAKGGTPHDTGAANVPRADTVLSLLLSGANPAPHVEGLALLPGKSHYFRGHDPANRAPENVIRRPRNHGWRTREQIAIGNLAEPLGICRSSAALASPVCRFAASEGRILRRVNGVRRLRASGPVPA
jgi:hypothetical protein